MPIDQELQDKFLQACRDGNLDVVKELFDSVADVSLTDEYGYTPLHIAVLNNRLEIMKELLDRGVDINIIGGENKDTPLSLCACSIYLNVAKELLARGADVNLTDKNKSTPLHIAVLNGRLEIVKELLNHGADFSLLNECKEAPLDIAKLCVIAKIREDYDLTENLAKHLEKIISLRSKIVASKSTKDASDLLNEAQHEGLLEQVMNAKKGGKNLSNELREKNIPAFKAFMNKVMELNEIDGSGENRQDTTVFVAGHAAAATPDPKRTAKGYGAVGRQPNASPRGEGHSLKGIVGRALAKFGRGRDGREEEEGKSLL